MPAPSRLSGLRSLAAGTRDNPLVRRGPRVFAVDHESVQVTWSSLPKSEVTLRAYPSSGSRSATGSGSVRTLDHAGGPGAMTVSLLPSSTDLVIEVSIDGELASKLTCRTSAPVPGEELDRFFTMSDLHLNKNDFGLRGTMVDRSGDPVPFAPRCATAAIAEATDWGARALIVKGDIVDFSTVEGWAIAGDTIGPAALPVGLDSWYLPGNHEINEWSDAAAVDAASAVGIHLIDSVELVERPGVHVVMADTGIDSVHSGTIARHQIEQICEHVAAARVAGALCIIVMHHQLQQTRVPLYYPPGIPAGPRDALVSALRRAGPVHLITSGHTHRHRRFEVGRIVCSEVGSPKDYPGTWGGYAVHEGGLRQIVRRVEAPNCIAWTEHSRFAAYGAWGVWSPGSLDDRCFTVLR